MHNYFLGILGAILIKLKHTNLKQNEFLYVGITNSLIQKHLQRYITNFLHMFECAQFSIYFKLLPLSLSSYKPNIRMCELSRVTVTTEQFSCKCKSTDFKLFRRSMVNATRLNSHIRIFSLCEDKLSGKTLKCIQNCALSNNMHVITFGDTSESKHQ